MIQLVWLFLGVAAAVPVLVGLFLLFCFFPLWLQAKATAVPLGFWEMGMIRLRGLAPQRILEAMVSLAKAGEAVTRADLETHMLSGGHLEPVVEGLISAGKAGLGVGFHDLAAIDLAGRDVRSAIASRVNPTVLVCPPERSGQTMISGVCQDGIRLGVKARVTVRTNLARLIGGAGEQTIGARVGEGIVAAIGRAVSHKDILAQPERISQYLLARGLDSGTCFEILSVDIADVTVLDNVGARLIAARAEADKKIAQAQAEMRRAAAAAQQQEMRAETVNSFAAVVAARSGMPLAAAAAFRDANIGRTRPLAALGANRLRWQWQVDR